MKSPPTDRRTFIKQAAAVGAGVWTCQSGLVASAAAANDKLNLAFIGVGGRGGANFNALKHQNVVALCDVDGRRAKKAFEAFPNVPKFVDFRQLLDKMENQIDGVVISTPDHTHFHPCYQALQMGKHVYLEKPLAHSVWETRTLCDLAREKQVATQLGVQRHTLQNVRQSVQQIQSGAIGQVHEVYCWVAGERGMPELPTEKPAVPRELDWDLWLGPTPPADYHPSIAPYGWRFWWDYGTGETGNWGCHILDLPYWALGLRYPKHVRAQGPPSDPARTPKQMQTQFEFAASDTHGPITLHWDHAKNGPDILRKHDLPHRGFNTLFLGSDGMLLTGFEKHRLLRSETAEPSEVADPVPQRVPSFYQEWVTACQGGPAATCHFDYSGPMAETVLLGNLAYRSQTAFDWESETLTASAPAAQALVRPKFRKGWELG